MEAGKQHRMRCLLKLLKFAHAVIRTEGLWAVGYHRCSKGKDWRCERCEQKG